MSSLVAYEDSESEDENFELNMARTSTQTESCYEKQQVTAWKSSGVEPSLHSFIPQAARSAQDFHKTIPKGNTSSLYCHSQPLNLASPYCCDNTAATHLCSDSRAPLNVGETEGRLSSLQRLPHIIQRSDNRLKSSKRLCSDLSGVRPYMPKRQRLGTVAAMEDSKFTGEQTKSNQTTESPILSGVSERIRHYIDEKLGVAGIPRKLLMSLGGHQGPVNTLQWSPIPHLSHLLLSASMDKTFKVWDGAESGRCLRAYTCHTGAVRDACWTPCGRRLLTGSFDNTAVITDVETGQQVGRFDNQFKVMCLGLHPSIPETFLCGGYSSVVKAWDSRCSKVVKLYKASIQQTLDILFLRGGVEFITSSDCVSRDSADRTLIAWDFQTTAKLSNQIYHERYTCPSLALHPLEEAFVAQTNGDYMAAFSSQKPYKMNKRRRYEGHKVEGYAVRCQFSLDGGILASGSSTGSAYFYNYHNAHLLHTLHAHRQACLCVSQHPVLPATAATCDWAGEIKLLLPVG
uniref:WD repeat domain 25 n=1 Tax=Takifugu rubripes TaxID=31033 RepID=A0A674NDP3_TAKRU